MKFLPYAVTVVLYVYCWIEIAQSQPSEVRQLPRGLWALIVVIPLFGAAAWLVYGRPNGTRQQSQPLTRSRSRTRAPDDDPDFLRSLRKPPPDNSRPPAK